MAVLAIELTWPEPPGPETQRYDPWTATARWERAIMEKATGFGGMLLPHAPSLLTVAFGLPRTLEQLPQRAVHAALAIQHLVAEAGTAGADGPCLEVRQAVHLGPMLVDVQARDPTERVLAVGETLALPMRLLGQAAPGDIVLSPRVGRMVEGWFELQARRLPFTAGTRERVGAYVVTRLRPQPAPLAVHEGQPLSRFVGRERELTVLHERLAWAEHGRGQVVGIVGEPGVGKSRLLFEFHQRLGGQRVTYLEGRCLSYGSTIPYLPVLDLLKAYLQIEKHDDGQQIREKLTDKIRRLDEALSPTLPAFCALLDVAVEDPQWQTLDPPQRRQRIQDALKLWLLRESAGQPVVVVFEDLHWSDWETQVFLDGLLESLPAARVLLLVSYRPEYQHAWGSKSAYTQLRLDPLPPESAGELLQDLLGESGSRVTPPLQPLKALLLDRTQGNPFFLEECVLTLVETGVLVGERGVYRLARAIPTVQVPERVQTVLAARIDRLPSTEKELLQEASVIGKDVPFPLLQAIAKRSVEDLRQPLSHLQAAEFLYEKSLFPELEYTFKHALTHEVAYGSLLQDRRRALHARIVEAIETLYPDRLADHVERLAHHALRGEVWDKALAYCRQAGDKAFTRSAYREAVIFFKEALAGLGRLPENRATLEQAIDLRFDLRRVLFGLGDLRPIFDCVREAQRLAETLDDQRRLGWASAYMTNYCRWVADHERALVDGRRALDIANALDDFPLRVATSFYLGMIHHAMGDYQQAIEILTGTVASLKGELIREYFGLAAPPSVFARAWLVLCLSERGEFAAAAALAEESHRIAEVVDHAYSRRLVTLAMGHLYLREGTVQPIIPALERELAVCEAGNLPGWYSPVASLLGASYAVSGRISDGIALLENAVERDVALGIGADHSLHLVRLGEAYLQVGRAEDATRLSLRAQELSEARRERGVRAWALRLQGDIAMHEDRPEVDNGHDGYRQALALADELGMRPLVAHCHLGLGALYTKIGQREQARAELAAASGGHASRGSCIRVSAWVQ